MKGLLRITASLTLSPSVICLITTQAAGNDEALSPDAKGPFGEVNSAPMIYPSSHVTAGGAHISSLDMYKQMYAQSISDPDTFWGQMAKEHLSWFRDFKEV